MNQSNLDFCETVVDELSMNGFEATIENPDKMMPIIIYTSFFGTIKIRCDYRNKNLMKEFWKFLRIYSIELKEYSTKNYNDLY